jgi:hypothetical protein
LSTQEGRPNNKAGQVHADGPRTEGGETRDIFTKKEEHEEEREQEATKNHCRHSPINLAQIFLEVSRYLHGEYFMSSYRNFVRVHLTTQDSSFFSRYSTS